jgi:hypothetical protein
VVDLAKALNRMDPIAVEFAGRDPVPDILIEGPAVRKLVGAVWFRSVFPRLSLSWRERMLDALAGSIEIPNHVLSRGRQAIHLADGSYKDLQEIAAKRSLSGAAAADLHFVLDVMRLWGEDALRRLRFVEAAAPDNASRLSTLFGLHS